MKIKLFAIGLSKDTSENPDFYYNHINDVWIRGFQLGCGFTCKEDAEKAERKLGLFGTEVVEGHAG